LLHLGKINHAAKNQRLIDNFYRVAKELQEKNMRSSDEAVTGTASSTTAAERDSNDCNDEKPANANAEEAVTVKKYDSKKGLVSPELTGQVQKQIRKVRFIRQLRSSSGVKKIIEEGEYENNQIDLLGLQRCKTIEQCVGDLIQKKQEQLEEDEVSPEEKKPTIVEAFVTDRGVTSSRLRVSSFHEEREDVPGASSPIPPVVSTLPSLHPLPPPTKSQPGPPMEEQLNSLMDSLVDDKINNDNNNQEKIHHTNPKDDMQQVGLVKAPKVTFRRKSLLGLRNSSSPKLRLEESTLDLASVVMQSVADIGDTVAINDAMQCKPILSTQERQEGTTVKLVGMPATQKRHGADAKSVAANRKSNTKNNNRIEDVYFFSEANEADKSNISASGNPLKSTAKSTQLIDLDLSFAVTPLSVQHSNNQLHNPSKPLSSNPFSGSRIRPRSAPIYTRGSRGNKL